MIRPWMSPVCAVVGVLLLAACSTTRESRIGGDVQWHGRIYPAVGPGQFAESNSVANATMTRLSGTNVRSTITLRGGLVQGDYPWHVHEGTCGSGGPIVGDPSEYPPLSTGSGTVGSATATFDADLDPDGAYYINIHRPEDLETIVACGQLRVG